VTAARAEGERAEGERAGGRPVRIGVLGAGFVGRRHVDRLVTLPGVEVVGVADPQRERAEALAGSCGARAVDGVRALVDLGLDGLYVGVPPHQHGEPEDVAIDAGVPVYLEKPLANDLSVAEDIGRRVRTAGLLVAVGYHWRYLDTLQTVLHRLADAPARLVLGAWLDKAPGTPWWADEAASGGQVIEQVTHLLDVARVVAGEAEVVRADATRDPRGPGTITHASTSTARFAGGAVGSFSASCLLAGGYRAAVEVVAPGVAMRLTEVDLTVVDADGERTVQAAVDPVLEADRAFVDAVRGGTAPVVGYEEALRTHRLACALTEAARTGEPVRLA
jgi:myo-inositol 2-dehydrogenase / D-chiro-inositol 1-dehydrogenase